MLVRRRSAVDASEQRLCRRITIVGCGSPRLIDDDVRLGPESLELLAVHRTDCLEGERESADWIAELPRGEIVLPLYSHVLILAMADVPSPPIRDELEEPWPLTGPHR